MQISFKTTTSEIYLVSVVVEGLVSKVPHAVLHVLSAAVYVLMSIPSVMASLSRLGVFKSCDIMARVKLQNNRIHIS